MHNQTIPTNRGAMTAEQLCAELTYVSYRHNRGAMSAGDLARLFAAHEALEARYQAEQAVAA